MKPKKKLVYTSCSEKVF